jgi:hypothetical protein
VGGTTVYTDTQHEGRHRQPSPRRSRRRARLAIAAVAAVAAVVIALALAAGVAERPAQVTKRPGAASAALPTAPGSYTGLYPDGAPGSYAQATAFTRATGVAPRLVTYYSGWFERFQTAFATTVAGHGGVPLVQIDPTGISLTAIAAGRYDSYLDAYARAVLAYRHPVILSFGHEMNGNWYTWGHRHQSPAAFVAAWRHIVTVFRAQRARNVTWLWTVNVIHGKHGVASPAPWWPGRSYVTWVGIDGYYFKASTTFPPLFGPTIEAVRRLTTEPILIAETAAAPAAGQPAKIAELFAGVRLYQLLGFVWFDSAHVRDWRLRQPEAIAAFRRVARAYRRPASLAKAQRICRTSPRNMIMADGSSSRLQSCRVMLPCWRMSNQMNPTRPYCCTPAASWLSAPVFPADGAAAVSVIITGSDESCFISTMVGPKKFAKLDGEVKYPSIPRMLT